MMPPDLAALMTPSAAQQPTGGAPAPVTATPTAAQDEGRSAVQDQTQQRLARWKVALAGAAVAPNGRQRIAALLKGSSGIGARRLGQYHEDMDVAADTNAQRQERTAQANADLERTAAEVGRVEATTGAETARQAASTAAARSSNAEAVEREARNTRLDETLGAERDQATANIELTRARTAAAEAEAEYRRAQASSEVGGSSKLGYVTSILQAQLGITPMEAVTMANSLLNASDPAKLKADLVAEYTSNILLTNDAGEPLTLQEKEALALEMAENVIDKDPRLHALEKHPDVVQALKGSPSLQLFMNMEPAMQDAKATEVRLRLAQQDSGT